MTITAKQLKKKRGELGCTQKELAEKIGVSPRTVEAWEQEKNPVPESTSRLLETFHAPNESNNTSLNKVRRVRQK
jgi:transcriptional regulator with XRE-family HTH domain